MKSIVSISRDYWVYLDITLQSFKIWEFWGEFWGIETFHRSKFSPATGVKDRILGNTWFQKTGSSRDRETRLFGAVSSRGKDWCVEVPPNNCHGPVRSLWGKSGEPDRALRSCICACACVYGILCVYALLYILCPILLKCTGIAFQQQQHFFISTTLAGQLLLGRGPPRCWNRQLHLLRVLLGKNVRVIQTFATQNLRAPRSAALSMPARLSPNLGLCAFRTQLLSSGLNPLLQVSVPFTSLPCIKTSMTSGSAHCHTSDTS